MSTQKKPNIILILTDDLGIGDVSCFNRQSRIPTGNIDALAESGMRFTDCHSSSAVCSPSRYALMTGRYNWRSRLKSGVLPGLSSSLIEDGRLTIGELMRQNGYRTACVGKWHLGMDWQTKNGYTLPKTYQEYFSDPLPEDGGIDYTAPIKNGPTDRGFDYYYGMPASLDQPPFVHIENDRVIREPDHMIGITGFNHADPGMLTEVEYGPAEPGFDARDIVPEMDQKVLDLIDGYAKGDQPFFIYYPTPAVHGPLLPSKEYEGKSAIGPYGDMVMQVDGFVGRLTETLERNGLRDDTIVIFTSDNGCSTIVDFLRLEGLGHYPSYIYRGTKGDIWDGGHRIPFIVSWPGHVPAGTVCGETCCLVDMMATFADLVGAELPDNAGEDSVSQLSLWTGGSGATRDYTVHHSLLGNFAIRKGPWKLECCAGSGSFNPPIEGKDTAGMPDYQLYDLASDIGEQVNLAEAYPEKLNELKTILTDCIRSGRSTPGAPQDNAACENWPGLNWM